MWDGIQKFLDIVMAVTGITAAVMYITKELNKRGK